MRVWHSLNPRSAERGGVVGWKVQKSEATVTLVVFLWILASGEFLSATEQLWPPESRHFAGKKPKEGQLQTCLIRSFCRQVFMGPQGTCIRRTTQHRIYPDTGQKNHCKGCSVFPLRRAPLCIACGILLHFIV